MFKLDVQYWNALKSRYLEKETPPGANYSLEFNFEQLSNSLKKFIQYELEDIDYSLWVHFSGKNKGYSRQTLQRLHDTRSKPYYPPTGVFIDLLCCYTYGKIYKDCVGLNLITDNLVEYRKLKFKSDDIEMNHYSDKRTNFLVQVPNNRVIEPQIYSDPDQLSRILRTAADQAYAAFLLYNNYNSLKAIELFLESNSICTNYLRSEQEPLAIKRAEFILIQNYHYLALIYFNYLGKIEKAKSICLIALPIAKKWEYLKDFYGTFCYIMAEIEVTLGNYDKLDEKGYIIEAQDIFLDSGEDKILASLFELEKRIKANSKSQKIYLKDHVNNFSILKRNILESFPFYAPIYEMIRQKSFDKAQEALIKELPYWSAPLQKGVLIELQSYIDFAKGNDNYKSTLQSAIEQYEIVAVISEDTKSKVTALILLWVSQFELGNDIRGINAFGQIYEIHKELGNTYLIATIAFDLGCFYKALGLINMAIKVWETNIVYLDNTSNSFLKYNFNIQLCSAYASIKSDIPQALQYFNIAQRINTEYRLNYDLTELYNKLMFTSKWVNNPLSRLISKIKNLKRQLSN